MPINPHAITPKDLTCGFEIVDCCGVPLVKRDIEVHSEKHWVVGASKFIELGLGAGSICVSSGTTAHSIGVICATVLPDESDIDPC
ncbi:hypothetical protein CIP107578_00134 [Corynebacterium diphtheriae]|nr:hypothetical protein CIP107578_00134 [Corynebacterium diphtheriae]